MALHEFNAVAASFEAKIERCAPRFVAFLGKAAYAALSGQKQVPWGRQAELFGGCPVWVLPNPSGRNLAFTQGDLVEAYQALFLAIEA